MKYKIEYLFKFPPSKKNKNYIKYHEKIYNEIIKTYYKTFDMNSFTF